jgi:hypothetical protein
MNMQAPIRARKLRQRIKVMDIKREGLLMEIEVNIIVEGQYLSNIVLFLNVGFSELTPLKAA